MDSRNAQSSFTCKSAASFVLTFPATAFTSLGMGISSAGVTRCEKTFYCDLKNTFPLVSNFLQSICVIDIDDSLIIRDTFSSNSKIPLAFAPQTTCQSQDCNRFTFLDYPELFIRSEHFRSKIFSRFLHSRVDRLDASDEAELKMKKHFKYVHNTRVRNDSGIIDNLKPL